jgi:hypothetical protein
MFIYPRTTNGKVEAKIPFCITKKDILVGVVEWSSNHQPPFIEVETQFNIQTKKS